MACGGSNRRELRGRSSRARKFQDFWLFWLFDIEGATFFQLFGNFTISATAEARLQPPTKIVVYIRARIYTKIGPNTLRVNSQVP